MHVSKPSKIAIANRPVRISIMQAFGSLVPRPHPLFNVTVWPGDEARLLVYNVYTREYAVASANATHAHSYVSGWGLLPMPGHHR